MWQFSGVSPLFMTKMVNGLTANRIQRVLTKLTLIQNATMMRNQKVIGCKDHSPERHVWKVCLLSINLRDKVEEEAWDSCCENDWNHSSFFGFFRWEVICDFVKELVVISDTCISCLGGALVEVELKSSKLFLECVNGSWILNVQVELVISIDLLRHELAKMCADLMSLDAWHVICMDWICDLVLFLESHVNTLWVVHLVLVSCELGIDLNVQDGEIICVQLLEDLWISVWVLVNSGSVPSLELGNVSCSIFVNHRFKHEGLCNIDWLALSLRIFKLESKSIAGPLHLLNVIKCYEHLRATTFKSGWVGHILFLVLSWIQLDPSYLFDSAQFRESTKCIFAVVF